MSLKNSYYHGVLNIGGRFPRQSHGASPVNLEISQHLSIFQLQGPKNGYL